MSTARHLRARRRILTEPRVEAPFIRSQAWHLTLVGMAMAFGLLAGIDPILAVAGALSVAFVALTLSDLSIGLGLFTVVTFLDVLEPSGGPTLSVAKLAGLVLAFAWFAKVVTRASGGQGFAGAHPTMAYVLVAFLAWMTLAAAVSGSPGHSLSVVVTRYAPNVLLFVIAYSAIRNDSGAAGTVWCFVLAATAAAIYGFLAVPVDSSGADPSRLTGTLGDPNQTAAILVPSVPLLVALGATARKPSLARRLAFAAAAVCTLGVFLTLSRGGLVAFAVASVAAVLVAGRWRRRVAALAIVAALSAVLYFALLASPAAIQRVTTSADGGAGRTDIWTVGWRMVEANPLFGVGAGNFSSSTVHYLIRPGLLSAPLFIGTAPKVAHNTYLEVFAELGIVGAALFIAILAFSVRCALQAARSFAGQGNDRMEALSRALLVAIMAVLAADFFLSAEISKQLWLLLAFGPALLAVAERPVPTSTRAHRNREA